MAAAGARPADPGARPAAAQARPARALSVREPPDRRVVGVDVARALALFGMAATHLLPAGDGLQLTWVHQVAAGRASALFALLAGVSIALLTGGRTPPPRGGVARRAAHVRVVVRAVLIGLLGLLLGVPSTGIAVILTYYAVLFVLALPLLGLRPRVLLALGCAWVVAAPVASHLVRPHLPERGFASPAPGRLAHPGELVSELLLTGYYPALVWLAYLLVGLALGRSDLRRPWLAPGLMAGGAGLAVLATVTSQALLAQPGAEPVLRSPLAQDLHGSTPTDSWWWLATVAPHSGTPFDLAQTTGSALGVLGLCLLLSRFGRRWWAVVFGAGAASLTVYSLHLLFLVRGRWPDLEGPEHLGTHVLLLGGLGAALGALSLKGPLEWVVSRVSAGLADLLVHPARRRTGP